MGFSLSWNATRGIGADAALALQELAATGVDANYLESPVSAVSLEGGWLLVVASGCDHRITSASILAKLSVGCEVVACTVEEHVMFSSSELWSDGRRVWRVEHDAQLAFDHLIATGSPPDDFASTRAHFAAQQEAEGGAKAEVDFYFEIPLVLAQSRVGFKHDETSAESTDGRFNVLSDFGTHNKSNRPWWQFWR